jgi:hypothetical protein
MAVLTRSAINLQGSVVLAGTAAAAGGDSSLNTDGKLLLFVNNGGASSINVTAVVQNAAQTNAAGSPLTASSLVTAVAAGARAIIGPFSPEIYNDATGQVQFTYSAVTSVNVQALAHRP